MRNSNRVAVIGVDMEATGDEAICDALRLIAAGALETAHLLFIVDPKQVLDDSDLRALEYEEASLARAPAMLEARAQLLAQGLGIQVASDRVRGHGRLGDPAETLLQMCVDYEADLLIVGTHGRRGFDRWLEGSVAEHVVRHAHCPVLVARPKDYSGLARTVLPDPAYAPGEPRPQRSQREPHTHASTTLDSWAPSDNGPTGFRIV
jgi:nucleotide-binding universal stress UspA family protein